MKLHTTTTPAFRLALLRSWPLHSLGCQARRWGEPSLRAPLRGPAAAGLLLAAALVLALAAAARLSLAAETQPSGQPAAQVQPIAATLHPAPAPSRMEDDPPEDPDPEMPGDTNPNPEEAQVPDQEVNEDADNTVLWMNDYFGDPENPEDPDNNCTFEITGNTNPDLFDSININAATGQLTIDYAADHHGSADITIRATNSENQHTDSIFEVAVNPVNDEPRIVEFGGLEGPTLWEFSGKVIDEDPDGLIVTFGGILEGYTATVHSDGTFVLYVDLAEQGTVTCATTDSDGVDSNIALYTVTP